MEDRINDSVLARMLGDIPTCNMGCDKDTKWGLTGYPLAMVYSTVQPFEELYELDEALASGTIFKKLDLPFCGMTVTRRGGACRG